MAAAVQMVMLVEHLAPVAVVPKEALGEQEVAKVVPVIAAKKVAQEPAKSVILGVKVIRLAVPKEVQEMLVVARV